MVAKSKKQAQPVQELTDEEWEELIDGAARCHLGISGEEFKRRWAAGEYPDPDDTPGVMAVAMLLPFDSFAR
jgi:hypothetical protein